MMYGDDSAECTVSSFWPQNQNALEKHHLLFGYTRLMWEHSGHGAKYTLVYSPSSGLNHERLWFVCLGKWQNLYSCTNAFQWMIHLDLMLVYGLCYILQEKFIILE